MRQMRIKFFICICQLFVVTAGLLAEELDPVQELSAKGIFEQIFSPFCPGRSLNDCPSSKAHELKDQIRSDLKAGKDPDAVLQSVFAQYGEQYRALPKASGMGMIAWLLPCVFLALGVTAILLMTKKRRKLTSKEINQDYPSAAKLDPKMTKEIEEALRDDS